MSHREPGSCGLASVLAGQNWPQHGGHDRRRSHRQVAGRPGLRGASLSENTQWQRLRTLRVFFERIIEWDWAATPPRNPILNWDQPRRPEPLPTCCGL